jgi:CheY-like chemotaxis protein
MVFDGNLDPVAWTHGSGLPTHLRERDDVADAQTIRPLDPHRSRRRDGGGRVSISILLADDQPLLRLGFRLVLDTQDDMHVVGEAADGGAALELVQAKRPDVVLMDVRMPGMDGIEATRRIINSASATRVLILTTFDLDEYAYAGLRAQ